MYNELWYVQIMWNTFGKKCNIKYSYLHILIYTHQCLHFNLYIVKFILNVINTINLSS